MIGVDGESLIGHTRAIVNEKQSKQVKRLPEGVPPEAVWPDDSRPFIDALVTGSWSRLRFWHWLMPLGVVLLFAVLFVSPLVTGNVSLVESRSLEMLAFVAVLLAVYGMGIVLGRRRYRRDGDLPRTRKLVLQIVAWGWGVLAVVLGVAHFFGGFALRSIYLSMTPAMVRGLLAWVVCLRLGLLGEPRADKKLRCAACDYPYEGTASDQCPECGAAWHEPAALLARHSKKERWNAGRAVLFTSLFVIVYLSLMNREKFSALTPTGRLVASVGVHGQSYDSGLWQQINRRTLTQTQTARLAERIVDEPSDERLNGFASDWFVDRLRAGEVPQDIVERYIRDRVALTLHAAPADPGGEVRTVAVVKAGGRSHHRLSFYLAGVGFSVDNGPPDAQAVRYQSIRHSGNASEEERTERWLHTFVGLDPGERELGFACWIVLMDGSLFGSPIVWQTTDTLAPPPGSLAAVRLQANTAITVPQQP